MGKTKTELLSKAVRHSGVEQFNIVSLIDGMQGSAFQAKNVARAAHIYDQILTDKNCEVILCLNGSLINLSVKKTITDICKAA